MSDSYKCECCGASPARKVQLRRKVRGRIFAVTQIWVVRCRKHSAPRYITISR